MRGEPLCSRSADFCLVACQKRSDRNVQHDGTVIGLITGVVLHTACLLMRRIVRA